MIQQSDAENTIQSGQAWQMALKQAIRDPHELLALLGLKLEQVGPLPEAGLHNFPLRVPRGFVARMEPGNPQDPLFLQVWPQGQEDRAVPGFSADPLQELSVNPAKGLLQKFQGRVLLTVTGGCAVHCRYCFRRHFPYQDNRPGTAGWGEALDHIRADSSITEVILSGGDPLLVPDGTLISLLTQLATIPHLKRLRIHSRLPVVLPERITQALVDHLKSHNLQVVMVIHANHPQEFDGSVQRALNRMRQGDITLLNQAVLLRGVNDSLAALAGLCETGFEAGVLPYYLHLLDRVQGAAHFEVPEDQALALYEQLQAALPGYLVPKLVREVPGAESKISVSTSL